MKIWFDKYRPRSLSDFGYNIALERLKDFIFNYNHQGKKCVLIHGPAGSGKTSALYVVASNLDYEILEINASDIRNKDSINQIVGKSLKQKSLFSKGKVILVDEIDGLSGTKDRGGVQALIKLIVDSYWPVVLTANDPWQSKLSGLRNKSLMIEFKEFEKEFIFKILKKICKNEKIKCDDLVLKGVIDNSKGDMRSAINDLQTISLGKKELRMKDLLTLGDRNKKSTVFKVLKNILQDRDKEVLKVLDKVDMNLDESFLWIDENLPLEYKGEELKKAYECLSRADVFRGRILRRQHWRFLVYQNALMTAGVSLSKEHEKKGFVSYKRTSRILKLWKAKMKYQKRKVIAEKIAVKTHSSKERVIKDFLPYIKHVLIKDDVARDLDLDYEEVEWLKNSN